MKTFFGLLFLAFAGALFGQGAPAALPLTGTVLYSEHGSDVETALYLLHVDGRYTKSVGPYGVTGAGAWSYRRVNAGLAEMAIDGVVRRLTYTGSNFGTVTGAGQHTEFVLNYGSVTAQVPNVSMRTYVRAGSTAIVGFVVQRQDASVFIRAVGPGLKSFGVADTLPRAKIDVRATATDRYVGQNRGWESEAVVNRSFATMVGAFPLAENSQDAALALRLPPGGYTAEIAGLLSDDAGEVLIEIYVVQ